jgi:N12 class adenine-specific DNA methylase
MRKNILVICYNYALSRRVASVLAERFDMRSFDFYEMFKFNNAPNTLEDVLSINGKEYVDRKMRGVLKTELDFLGVVFVADTKVLVSNQDLFEKLKENNIVLLLKNDFKTEFAQRENISFMSEAEKEYFSLQLDELRLAEQTLEDHFADIVVDISELGYSEIIEKIVSSLDNCGQL